MARARERDGKKKEGGRIENIEEMTGRRVWRVVFWI